MLSVKKLQRCIINKSRVQWTLPFFRQDNSGMWSQKFGHWKATNLDGDGKLIADPRTAKPIHKVGNEYKFCGYFCVPSNKYKETNTARLISNIRHPKNS